MPYSPKGFSDIPGPARMAPSESRPPLNFADGGAVNWASDSSIYNTQSQLGNIAATPGGFGGMAKQFTSEGPFGMNPISQPQMAPMTSGNLPMQPKPIMPPMTPLAKMPPASMAKGGRVENLMTQLRQEFKKRGLDFDKVMAKRLAEKGQGGDTILAHINPKEAAMLKQAGGSGSINPHTGLPSFRVDDDGPERGATGSASSTGYSGGPSGGSAEGFAARAGDTPGFGSGGGGSVGGGGGYGVTDRGDIAGGGDRGGFNPYDNSYTGMVETQSQRMQRLVEENRQRVLAQKAAEETAKANAARIAAEREAYQQPPQQSILNQIGNVIGQTIGVTPAEAGTAPWSFGKPVSTTETISETDKQAALAAYAQRRKTAEQIAKEADLAERQAQAAIDAESFRSGIQTGLPAQLMAGLGAPVGQTTTFGTGIVPAGVFTDQGMSMPGVRSPEQVEEATRERTIPEKIAEFVNPGGGSLKYEPKYRLPDVGLRIGSQGTPAITTEGESPFKAVVDAITSETTAPLGISTSMSPAAIQAAQQQSMSKLASAMANAPAKKTFDEYGATTEGEPAPVVQATIPFPTPVPGRVAATPVAETPAAPAGVLSKVPAQPVTAGQATVTAPIYSADPNIAALEKTGKNFAGGSREQVAAALGVDPSQLKERIVFYDGTPRVDYYTKDWGQALGEAFSGLPNLISGLTTPSVYSTPRGSFVRDPQFSDLFTQTEERRDYGPYGDMTLEEYRKLYGGKEDLPPIVKPKTEVETKTETTPETKTPVGKPATAEWSRTRTGLPSDPYNYGYGGEYTYFSAKGGHVGPLSKIRK